MSDTPAFELQGPGPVALAGLGLLVIALPAVVTAVALRATAARGSGATVLAAVVLVSLLVFAALAVVTARRELRVSPEGLALRSSFYRLTLERSAIIVGDIRAVDCSKDREYGVTMRTNGIAFPGYQSGWFRTRSQAKAFVVRAGPACVAVPTTRGFTLLLGASDPERTAAALRAQLA